MRVICPHCRSKAFISSTNELTLTVKDLYCHCTNAEVCGATFVFTLSFKHDLNPPQQTIMQVAAALVSRLPPEQRKKLVQGDLFE